MIDRLRRQRRLLGATLLLAAFSLLYSFWYEPFQASAVRWQRQWVTLHKKLAQARQLLAHEPALQSQSGSPGSGGAWAGGQVGALERLETIARETSAALERIRPIPAEADSGEAGSIELSVLAEPSNWTRFLYRIEKMESRFQVERMHCESADIPGNLRCSVQVDLSNFD